MSMIREFHICGYCGKKQAGVNERWPGYTVIRCRTCKCEASYGPESYADYPIWPGGAQAARDLLYSNAARSYRANARRVAYNQADEAAWTLLYEAAKTVAGLRNLDSIDRLTEALAQLDALEDAGPKAFPPTEPQRAA